MATTPIPVIDIVPPMSPAVRQFAYGVLAWAAGILTIISAVVLAVPVWHLDRGLVVANIIVNGLWTLLGFKAGNNVSSRKL